MERMTNKEFSKTNKKFIEACKNVNVDPTTRQASKWRNKKGIAYLIHFLGGDDNNKEEIVKKYLGDISPERFEKLYTQAIAPKSMPPLKYGKIDINKRYVI